MTTFNMFSSVQSNICAQEVVFFFNIYCNTIYILSFYSLSLGINKEV